MKTSNISLKSSNLILAVIYTVGHLFIAMACALIITGAAINLAAIDAIIEPLINGFWFYALHKIWVESKVEYTDVINEFKGYKFFSKINGFTLALIYTIGHFGIAMTCASLITGVALNLAAIDAIVEPLINGVWFYLLHKIWFRMFMKNGIVESGMLSSINSSVLSPKGRYSKKENQEV